MHFDQTVPRFRIPHSEIRNSVWLPAALLATLTLLVGALQALGGESDLQWRRASTPSHPATSHSASRARLILTDQRDERGYAVVQVAYTPDGQGSSAAATGRPAGEATLHSVLVYPQDSEPGAPLEVAETQHVAQSPFNDDDEQLGRELAEPFGLPEMEETVPEEPEGMDELPEPTLPEMEETPVPDIDLRGQPDGVDRDPPTTPRILEPAPRERDDEPERDPFERAGEEAIEPGDDESRERERRRAEELTKERTRSQESCAEELANLKANRITTIDLSIAVTGEEGRDYPFECAIDDGSLYPGRCWHETTYMWKAAANCHKPLYFEQHHLERYGHSWGPCLQPICSGVHFFTRLPVLPYCKGLYPPNECIYPLGHYRPGNCAPYLVDPIPFTWRAALFQAGATVGTAGILP